MMNMEETIWKWWCARCGYSGGGILRYKWREII